jgi:hypothetical protein
MYLYIMHIMNFPKSQALFSINTSTFFDTDGNDGLNFDLSTEMDHQITRNSTLM